MAKVNVLVTGATGFVGRHWVYRLLTAAPEARVTALVRGESPAQARARLEKLLRGLEPDYGAGLAESHLARLDVIVGDVDRSECGVREATRAALRGHVSQVWHLAATTDFRAERKQATHARNVTATARVLALAGELGAPDFFHVSTAYVCGRMQGLIPEELHAAGDGFNNPYEESKHESEQLVLRECARAQIRGHILRPSIIVAPKSTLAARGANHGLYGFLRGVYAVREVLRGEPGLRVQGNPEALLNLIGVDDVADEMLAAQRAPERAPTVTHIVSDDDVTASEVMAAVCEAAGIATLRVQTAALEAPNLLEQALARQVAVYSAYLYGVRRFERRSRQPRRFFVSELRDCCNNWVAEREARDAAPAPLRPPAELTPSAA